MSTSISAPDSRLAVRDFSDQELKRRIEAATKPGFGLADATPSQLNMIYLLGQRYQVDPISDITLFQGRPHFTIDGRVRMMRRHPQYRGYVCRPLPAEEKSAWNYADGDIVVECTIRTRDWGEISARGKVTPIERQRNTPTGTHPQEMAEKRAIARASRLAFGQDVPDEDEIGAVVLERDDPIRTATLAQRHTEIFGTEADRDALPAPAPRPRPTTSAQGPTTPEAAAPGSSHSPGVPQLRTTEVVNAQRSDLWADNRRLSTKAAELGIRDVPTLSTRATNEELEVANEALRVAIKSVEDDLVGEAPDEQQALV